MAEGSPSTTIGLRHRTPDSPNGESRLATWVVFSLLVHGALLTALALSPYLPASTPEKPLVYTVDLVGGERIGATSLGTSLAPGASLEQPATKLPVPVKKEVTKVPPPPPPERKREKEITSEKSKPMTDKTQVPEKVIPIKEPKKEPIKAEQKKNDAKEAVKALGKTDPAETRKSKEVNSKATEDATQNTSLDQVRERLLRSAVENAKGRGGDTVPKESIGKAYSQGDGEGVGASALGPGGRGGPGIVRGMDFLIYRNRMLETIKTNWAWPGQRGQIKVVVSFAVRDNGEIGSLKIITPSGDPSFDESVLRALKKSSPLPPPPSEYRRDFSNVEVTFRPQDLGA